jgi:hypothetical protein
MIAELRVVAAALLYLEVGTKEDERTVLWSMEDKLDGARNECDMMRIDKSLPSDREEKYCCFD